MYGREVAGRTLTFGVSGKLLANALVMYDHQTGSLWSHVRGEAVAGPLAGTRLTPLPAMHTTWGAWRRLHPETLVLDQARSPHRRDYARDPYRDYYASDAAGVLGAAPSDPRLSPKQFVVGVRRGGRSTAYPFALLSRLEVVNDDVGGPLAVVFDREAASAVVFDRRVGGRVLALEPAGRRRLRDLETGTVWHALTGRALEGPLAGARLVQVPATHAFWFGWRDNHPDTTVYTGAPETGEAAKGAAPR